MTIGTDSACFLEPFLALISKLWDPCVTPRLRSLKPYGLRPNGDLWQLVEQHLIARGPHSVEAFKVKAHTTLQDVAAGVITPGNRQGNGQADALAARGGRDRQYNLYALGTVYASIHMVYEHVLNRIHTHILNVFKFIDQERAKVGWQLLPPPFKAYSSASSCAEAFEGDGGPKGLSPCLIVPSLPPPLILTCPGCSLLVSFCRIPSRHRPELPSCTVGLSLLAFVWLPRSVLTGRVTFNKAQVG